MKTYTVVGFNLVCHSLKSFSAVSFNAACDLADKLTKDGYINVSISHTHLR